jgi:zeaxanthin glucosyltransferase
MSHIGILCPGAIGHLNPMCNLGDELLHRGHKVTLFGVPGVAEKISHSNIAFYEIGASDFPVGSMEAMYAQLGKLTGLEGLKFAIEFFQKEANMLFHEAPAAIRSAGIDLLLVDQVTRAGGTIADYLKLPFVTICNALPLNQEPDVPPYFTPWGYQNVWWAKLRNQLGYVLINSLTRSIRARLAHQRKEWQLSPLKTRDDAYSQLAQIAQLPQELDFPRKRVVPWFHYAGSFKNASNKETVLLNEQFFPLEDLNGKPLIYANLGTLQSHNLQVFHCIAEACLNTDAQLVISLGNPNADPSKTNFPGDPLVVPFPPHQQLIDRSELVISHAGSTAISCLSSGVPMVAIPITTDQPGMAARVARARAGEVVPLKKLTVDTLRTAIQQVLKNRTYRENAETIRSAIQKAGGISYAVDVIEQVIQTKAPAYNRRLHNFNLRR